ncbi:MAG: hemerythrin family protein [Acidobacteria bacterium]|nr:hemerythrin family protein [Acidobacteriota bacterium]MBI3488560.1 hemerythrin family protein [Acidobacteriota bacterium]
MEVAWSSRYDTGIRVIDEQHQELFGLLEQLRKVMREGDSGPALERLLAELVSCSEKHFATEEAYMARFSYPDLAQHVSEHAAMLTNLHELLRKFRENHQVMALMVPTFMEGWLKHHISDGDFGFVTFLKARNLT